MGFREALGCRLRDVIHHQRAAAGTSCLRREADAAHQVMEALVAVQRVEGRLYFDVREPGIALLICLFKPRESPVLVAKPHID